MNIPDIHTINENFVLFSKKLNKQNSHALSKKTQIIICPIIKL